MRLATIDIGTNTALLLVSEWENDRLREIHRASGFVRLGEGLDATGYISKNALKRLSDVLTSHMSVVRQIGANHVIVTGTSASRDARNSDEVRELVHGLTGADYIILSGSEEAEVTFLGAVSGWSGPAVLTVLDVGGGSTELVQGRVTTDGVTVDQQISLDIGSVRVTERFMSRIPPVEAEWQEASQYVADLIERGVRVFNQPVVLIGASGTSVLLGELYAQSMGWATIGTHGIPASVVQSWAHRLSGMTAEEVLALNPQRMQGRADVFAAGVLIVEQSMTALAATELFVSPFGVRHGVAIRYFRELQA